MKQSMEAMETINGSNENNQWKNMERNKEQSILEAIDYVRNVSKKRLSIADILSRISKPSASQPDPLKNNSTKWLLKD